MTVRSAQTSNRFRLAARMTAMVMASVLAACGGSGNGGQGSLPDDTAWVDAVNAVPDAPTLGFFAGDITMQDSLDYASASGLLALPSGTSEIRIVANRPGENVDAIDPIDVELWDAEWMTLLAIGTMDDVELLVLSAPLPDLGVGEISFNAVHAAPGIGMLDLYITDPAADFTTASPAGTFQFRDDIGPIDLPSGSQRFRLTEAGNPENVIFDSGGRQFQEGLQATLAVVENTGTGDSPVRLILLDGFGGLSIFDVDAPVLTRVVHGAADVAALDVVFDDEFEAPHFADLTFLSTPEYESVPPNPNLKIVPAGEEEPLMVDANPDLRRGFAYTLFLPGTEQDLLPMLLPDDNRAVAGESRLRIVHGSPGTERVDIYVLAAGEFVDETDPTFPSMPFRASTGYVPMEPGTYDIVVTATGSEEALITLTAIMLEAGGVYTAVTHDAAGGGAPYDVMLMDDFQAND